ncbi:MAG: hypothetical protein QM784_05715 [Polyangiaceae bacterium]
MSVSLGATECPAEGRDYVRLVFEPEPSQPSCSEEARLSRERIARLIEANLDSEHVDACQSPAQVYRLPLATLTIELPCDDGVQARIVVSDAVTDKLLSRQIPLEGLPRDTHAMAVAVGAVELLRASWAETRLNGTRPGRGAYPEAVGALLDHPTKSSRPRLSVGIDVAGEAFRGGLRLLGVDADVAWAVHPRLELMARLGGRRSRRETSLHGDVTADVWLAGIGVGYLVLPPNSRFELRALTRFDGAWIDFSSDAVGKAVATSRDAGTAWIGLGLGSAVRVWDSTWLTTEATGGWVVWPVVATDAGKTVMGARGGYVSGRIGLKVHF